MLGKKRIAPDNNLSDSSLKKQKDILEMEQRITSKETLCSTYSKIVPLKKDDSSILDLYYLLKDKKIKKEKEAEAKQNKLESGIKHCVVKLLQFIKDIINTFIQKSELKKDLKKEISMLNSKLFTSKLTESANYSSINYTNEDIFTIGKEKNFKIIKNIRNEINKLKDENASISEVLRMLNDIFDMRYSDSIVMFVNSKNFIDFQNEPLTIFYDEETKREKVPSFRDPKGFCYHLTLERKKRNKNKDKFEGIKNLENSNIAINNNFKDSSNINEEKEKNNENFYEKAIQAKHLSDVVLFLNEKVHELLKD